MWCILSIHDLFVSGDYAKPMDAVKKNCTTATIGCRLRRPAQTFVHFITPDWIHHHGSETFWHLRLIPEVGSVDVSALCASEKTLVAADAEKPQCEVH